MDAAEHELCARLGLFCKATEPLVRNEQPLLPDGYKFTKGFRAADMYYAFLAMSDLNAVLAFRGSHLFLDWIVNSLYDQKGFGGGKVHAGFWHLYDEMADDIRYELRDHKGPLDITGHSLGGALATLAASEHLGASVVTFAAPRVGDKDFRAELMRKRVSITRVVNSFDIVPRLPEKEMETPDGELVSYCHVGIEAKISFNTGSIVGNHLLENYLANLVADLPHEE